MAICEEVEPVFPSQPDAKFSGVWLDHLPFDVCTIVATFLKPVQVDPRELRATHISVFSEFHERTTVFPLASVSKLQRRAVEAAQAHTLQFESAKPSNTANLIQRWRHILRADIREVHLAIHLGTYREFDVLLSFPTLLKATIPCLPSLMRSLISCSTVKVLQLHLLKNFENGLPLLPELLRSSSVEELRLVCHQCDSFMAQQRGCVAMKLDSLANGPKFDSLRSLHLVCTSAKTETVVSTLSLFPNLEHFSLQRWTLGDDFHSHGDPVYIAASPEFAACMRSLKSVGMIHYGTVEQLVPILQERMASFSCHAPLSIEDIQKLDACPNLSSLDLVLSEGAESSFPMSLCALGSISLSWKSHQPAEKKEYYSPEHDFLVGLVSRNKQLEELRLRATQMSDETLEEMLACANRGLRILEVPVFHQGVCPLNRFLLLTRLIMRNDFRLSQLEADISSTVDATYLRNHDSSSCDGEECVFCSFPKHIKLATLLLKKRMPLLREDGLQRLRLVFAAW